ncbi:heterodisulfide reductase subunit B, partial [bacterium]|nr:heterodisulfide reductase subunit B [bacterium]
IIDYPERRHCCGFGFRQYLIQANRGYSISASRKKFESMEPYQPDLIIANCPGCAMFMDRWQYTIKEMDGITYGKNDQGIPVLTYEEMAGLVMGYNPWELGLQYHNVQSMPILRRMGIKADPAERFLAKDGTRLPEPVNLINE